MAMSQANIKQRRKKIQLKKRNQRREANGKATKAHFSTNSEALSNEQEKNFAEDKSEMTMSEGDRKRQN